MDNPFSIPSWYELGNKKRARGKKTREKKTREKKTKENRRKTNKRKKQEKNKQKKRKQEKNKQEKRKQVKNKPEKRNKQEKKHFKHKLILGDLRTYITPRQANTGPAVCEWWSTCDTCSTDMKFFTIKSHKGRVSGTQL